MNATYRRLQYEIKTLSETITADTKPSSSKKRRLRDVKKMEARVKAALDEGRIEEDLKDVRMEKVVSGMSTKQAMIARVGVRFITKLVNVLSKYIFSPRLFSLFTSTAQSIRHTTPARTISVSSFPRFSI